MNTRTSLFFAASAAAIAAGATGCATSGKVMPVAANDNYASGPPRSPTPLVAANDNHQSQTQGAGSSLTFVGKYLKGTDPRLVEVIDAAAREFPGYRVEAFSGYRKGDSRFHGKRKAVDIQLINKATGRTLPNYQDEGAFREHERFAQKVHEKQLLLYPHMPIRWGGYFSGGRNVYGAVDLMHFDIGATAMGGGSWEGGLTDAQRALWPHAKSVGLGRT